MSGTGLTLGDLAFLGQGALMTLAVTAIAVTGGTALGLMFGVVRTQVGPWWALPLTFLLDVFRSVPLLIQLILANAFQAIAGLGLPPFATSCIVLALYTSAYCAEIVRGAIDAVPAVTRRAARSLGLTWGQDMAHVVAPMALRVALPSWIGLTLGRDEGLGPRPLARPDRASALGPDPRDQAAGADDDPADRGCDLFPPELPRRPPGGHARTQVARE